MIGPRSVSIKWVELVDRLPQSPPPVRTCHCALISAWPYYLSACPADRIIAAAARAFGATLVTSDRRLLDFTLAGHLITLAV